MKMGIWLRKAFLICSCLGFGAVSKTLKHLATNLFAEHLDPVEYEKFIQIL